MLTETISAVTASNDNAVRPVLCVPEYERTRGAKYDADMTDAQISAAIRADIKAAVKSGKLPLGKYSVRTSGSSTHTSITITAKELAIDVLNAARVIADHDGSDDACKLPRLSASAVALVAALESIGNAYNKTETHWQSDYCNTRFYLDVAAEPWAHEREEILIRANRI